MALPQLVFQLNILFDKTFADNGGNWQYAAAEARNARGEIAKLAATKRDNSSTDESGKFVQFPASMLSGTLMFPSPGTPPEFITFQGVHDLESNDEWGTITAASPKYGGYVGGTFSFTASALSLSIDAP